MHSHSERLLVSALVKEPENKRARKLLRKVRAAMEAERMAVGKEIGQKGVDERAEQAEVEEARKRMRAALDRETERMASEVADARKAMAKIKGKTARKAVDEAQQVPEERRTEPVEAASVKGGGSGPVPEGKGRGGEGAPDASFSVAERPSSDVAGARFALGYGYLERGEFGEAVREYQLLVGFAPGDRYAYVNLGYACRMRGDFEGAESAFRKCIELSPETADGYNHLAYLYALNDTKLQEAEELAAKAHALAPRDAEILDTLGYVHFKNGRYGSAYDLFSRAARGCNLEEVEFHRALALGKLGKTSAARRAFERLRGRNGEYAAAAEQALAELAEQGTSGPPR
jgi:Flp pilus assembly protein TadD